MRSFLTSFLVLLLAVSAATSAWSQDATSADLWRSARAGDLEKVRRILDSGVDVDAKSNYGATALAFAAEQGHLELVKFLVERGADVNSKDTFYNATPLSWAQMGRHNEVANFLKENGGVASFGQPSSGDATVADDDPEGEPVEFAPCSAESRLLDRRYASVNWPQFRGNGARGIADGQQPPIEWDVESGKGVAWKVATPGLGHSCPAIWGDRIFLTSAISGAQKESIQIGNYGSVDSVDDDSEHEFIVFAINKHTGETEWQQTAVKTVPKVKRHLKSTHANPTVACNEHAIVAFFGSEGLFCYSHDGELKWQKDLGFLDSGWFYDRDYQWGFAASPIIFEDTVIVQCDIQENSFIAAFDLLSGEEKWRTSREEIPSWSTPTIYFDQDRPLAVTNGTRAIRGYDVRTGEEVWTFQAENSEIVTPTPIVSQDKILVTAGYSPIMPIYAINTAARGPFQLDKQERSNEHIAWSHRNGGPYMPTPIAYGDYFYVCNNTGILTCYHLPSGKEVYKERLKGVKSLSFVASCLAADGHLYFFSENGQTIVVKSGPQFELIAVNQAGINVLSTPAISEGRIYIRGVDSLIAVEQ
ncbi:MAG TPA: ankyrin repeat domain-containing protein [Pirellulaceae bacterium]|nr:ankyrin repeat domain-containing protein [Pirellulaceae bacterium]HMO92212.1 ankyrin repeat domain-containing protein [Pirellulaceae bacterium]HMP68861.1 ankyrin repeat domain-containing protein [Pirellulaceae bacterium]